MPMIRLFTVLCKLNDIKISDQKWFEDALKIPLPPDHSCPHCSAGGLLRPFGHYERYLVEWDGSAQVSNTVTVPRYICDSCGHTHAALPCCIIPYRSYSLRFVLTVLRAYFIRSCPIEQICSHYGVTVATLYRWLQLFRQQKALWLGVLEDAAVSPVMFIGMGDGAFLKNFFCAFRFSYLEQPHGTDPGMPSGKRPYPGSIT